MLTEQEKTACVEFLDGMRNIDGVRYEFATAGNVLQKIEGMGGDDIRITYLDNTGHEQKQGFKKSPYEVGKVA